MHELNLNNKPVPKSKDISGVIVGIDLGTTNCAATLYTAGTVPTLLPIGGPEKFTMQSCVRWDGFDENQEPLFTVGEEAYKERYKPNVIYSVKRLMGSGEKVTFHATEEVNLGDQKTSREFLSTTPAAVSSIILKEIKKRVVELNEDFKDCVITVPAYFNQRQIEDTISAATMAGMNCRQILKEPTSASYIYSQLGYAQNGSVLIYDLGGGTFDVTHMTFLRRDSIPSKMLTSLKRQYGISINNSGADINDQYFCRVLGTYGDVNLGGDDIDKAMGDAIIAAQGLELTDSEREELYLRCEGFKKMGVYGADVVIGGKKIHFSGSYLDAAVDKIFDRTMDIIAGLDFSDVTTILLVGGSTKSQRIRDNLSSRFPGVEISAVLDPDATVALGAGAVAKAIANDAALMYADVLPLPIGILVDESTVETCIAKNTSMPYTVRKTFYTLHDNQEQVGLKVYQGLSTDPKECTYLGSLTVKGVPKAPAGETRVEVSFTLTAQGRLKILSHINGVDKDEELVIESIFSVNSSADSNAAGKELDAQGDEFEECFMVLAESVPEAQKLFEQRRAVLQNGGDVSDIEDRIVQMLMS